MHVRSESRVVLQTAQGILKGAQNAARIRVMFDTGSHKSFVTSKVVRAAGLPVKRKEWLEISTFVKAINNYKLRDVFDVEIAPCKGEEAVTIEAYCVETIAQVRNEHIELRKGEYPHLRGLWFSDMCKSSEVFNIDILVGSDFLWCFQSGTIVRGRAHEPVAVETTLGWVLSGQVKGKGDDGAKAQVSCVNIIKEEHVSSPYMSDNVHRLWDLDTLGIREEDEVHKALKEAISFNGNRYQVHLPWKQGHEPLPLNYNNSLKRLKTKFQNRSEIRIFWRNITKLLVVS